jgi:alanine dehydrogenase
MAIRKPFISSSIHYEPLEETLDVKPSSSSLKIAIPKENAFQENRIALTPKS